MSFAAPRLGAGLIPITNGDFETGPYQTSNVVSGWIVDHAYTWVQYLPEGGSYFGLLNAPDNNPASGQGAIHQILDTEWESGTYELSLIVVNYYGWQGYDGGVLVELKAGASVLGSKTYTPSPVSGGYDSGFYPLTMSLSLDAGNSANGQAIGIYFTHTGAGGAYIDDVALTLLPVPEPAGICLTIGGMGLMGVISARRRRESRRNGLNEA